MSERPYSRYTRERTWAALHSQHLNAGYALVPYSATNNSIAVIKCSSFDDAQKTMVLLLAQAETCRAYYASKQTPDKAPAILEKAREAVVLARSSDYYHYNLSNYVQFKLVIAGLHDSYLRLPVLEMRTNKRYGARETAIAITDPSFEKLRCTQFGHNILIAALSEGDPSAIAFIDKEDFPVRTRTRLVQQAQELQDSRYQGRPLAFQTDAEREEVGKKISESLKRYYAQKRRGAI